MLNKLRDRISTYINKLAASLSKTGIKPNHLTLFGFICVVIAGLPIIYLNPPISVYLFIILILLSGVFDLLDGALARYLGATSKLGSFTDSITDRFSDAIIFIYLILAPLHADPLLIIISAITSQLISYIRAKAESLGVTMQGIGLMERAERVFFIILSLLISIYIPIFNYLLIVFIILNIITIGQRIYHVFTNLKS